MSAIFGERLTFPQGDGTTVELVVYGDEMRARYETPAGCTAVFDADRALWCYALLAVGHLVSSGVPVTKPVPPGVRMHLKESPGVRAAAIRARHDTLRPRPPEVPGLTRTFGANRGLLPGRRVSAGQVRGLTVLVQFADLASTVTSADVAAMLNDEGYRRNGNSGSVRDYFLAMSAGKLDYRNVVVGPVTLPMPQAHYVANSLVQPALTAAVNDLGVNLADFDSRGEGVVDAVNFLYAGRTLYQGELWPHNAERRLTFGNVRTNFYMLTSMGRSPVDLSIGTICHESGHLLCRFPDLYDYGERDGDLEESSGIGYYCLMGAGNHLGGGRQPSAVCAYLRDLVAWYDEHVSLASPAQYTVAAGESRRVHKYDTPRPNEYFLVENRTATGQDAALPASGLAVYHCDTLGSNEWEDGTRERHYQVALLQSDGHLDLEHGSNLGDATDLYGADPGVALADSTTPSSRMWDGTGSGLVISAVTGPGATISFRTGLLPTAPASTAETVADLLIPDDDPDGARSILELAAPGVLTGLTVEVDLIHPWIGDLTATLIDPGGTEAVLRTRTGGSADDLHARYDSDAPGSPLATLVGRPAAGAWMLHVVDHVRRDTGRLDRWRIEARTAPADGPVEVRSLPGTAIPDASPAGIEDRIDVAEGGTVRTVRVEVEIRHTFVGDLTVDLVPPAGPVVVLRERTGGAADDLRATFDMTTTPGLATLAGTPVRGAWVLRVRDTARHDTGVLERWALSIGR
ncbi:MAG: M6 family metalloprotease domain-containing protein [Georgenia sp.]